MNAAKLSLRPENWYSLYHKATERMVNVKYLGTRHRTMEFTDGERQRYAEQDFYFWKRTE